MTLRSWGGLFAALGATWLGAGCVVVPTQVYIADPDAGRPVYESCSLTPELPMGVRVERPQLQTIVSIVPLQGGLVRVQFDIPEGTSVTLLDNRIRLDVKGGSAPRFAPIAHVNPAAPARVPETPAIQALVMPVDAPMRGGRLHAGAASSDKHYWIAAPLGDLTAAELWITLPALSVNGVATTFEAIHFVRRAAIGVGLFNC